ncbi:MAG: family acetyltransferase [Flaviaesturariibacter sp.]|nr:family acetyltransferase [Flaviaesturariibacter sp.]
MEKSLTYQLLGQWLTGWCLSRALPLPEAYRSGFRVDVGYEQQKQRYVFPALHEDVRETALSLTQPWHYLKVCAPCGELERMLPAGWTIQPQGYLMTCFSTMKIRSVAAASTYAVQWHEDRATFLLELAATDGSVAASGRLVLVNDLAVFDRISTAPAHRRKGLATFVVGSLAEKALAKGITKNCLVATEEGRYLYASLGWELCSFYSSAVIVGM